MRTLSLLLAPCLLFSCTGRNPDSISVSDANSLISTALLRDAGMTRDHRLVCVQKEFFDNPLRQLRQDWASGAGGEKWKQYGVDQPLNPTPAREIHGALKTIVEGGGKAAPISEISAVPTPLVLFSEKSKDRKGCDANEFGLPTVYLTQPVVAGGFAFIHHAIGCGAMCGASAVDVYEKREGKWIPIATGFHGSA